MHTLIPSAALGGFLALAHPPASPREDGPPLAEYFRAETARIAARPLLGIDSAEAWRARRPGLQAKLKGMLGLAPEPPRGDLRVEARGTVERPDFLIEKIVYQSMPGLYVTANLYRPKNPVGRSPAILYVCGHSRVEKDGVIHGSKAHYQHHAAWFAANGYVCLIVDTLELGEVPGEHHGVSAKGRRWWISRGYTPAGVEAWNGVRAIDYLVSRPDVDPGRIGVTGRSGGGATSWWIGAIDDRVAAVCPVAGITDLQDHVVNGVVEGHCDCMYFVNTERWDDTMLAALVAPKPLLIENTDKDPIFPEAGVRRIYEQVGRVYDWYGARDRLSLIVGKGGHVDSEELRHPAFAFFEKWLKNKPGAPIVEPDRRVPSEMLRVLDKGEAFADSRNATIDETFVPKAPVPDVPKSAEEWGRMKAEILAKLKTKVVAGWPTDEEAGPLGVKLVGEFRERETRLRTYEFRSQPGILLSLWVFQRVDSGPIDRCTLVSLDPTHWDAVGPLVEAFRDGRAAALDRAMLPMPPEGKAIIYMAPRGIGPTAWPKAKDTGVRRRFALLGQTVAGMQAYDIRRAVAALREVPDLRDASKVELLGESETVPAALLAALFEPRVSKVVLLDGMPEEEPELLNLETIAGLSQLAAMVHPRDLYLAGPDRDIAWAESLLRRIDPQGEGSRYDFKRVMP